MFVPMLIEACVIDAHGDTHNDRVPAMLLRGGFVMLAACIGSLSYLHGNADVYFQWVAKTFGLGVGIYIFFFPLTVQYVLHRKGVIERKDWYNAWNPKVYPDKWMWYNSLPWWGRQILLFIPASAVVAPFYNLYSI